jgi:hypothetical protein
MLHLSLPAALNKIPLELWISLQLQAVHRRQRLDQFTLAFKRGIPEFDQPEVGPRMLSNAEHLIQDLWSRKVRPNRREYQGQGGRRPRNPHMTVHEQMEIRWRVSHEVTGKPQDVVDMLTLWRHQAFKVLKDVVKAQFKPSVLAEGGITRPFPDARIKNREHMAHATRGMAVEFSNATDRDLEWNKSPRRIPHNCVIPYTRCYARSPQNKEGRVSFCSGYEANEASAREGTPSLSVSRVAFWQTPATPSE